MAVEQIHEKANKIVDLFNKMSYETKDEDQELFKQWKTTHQPLKTLSVVDLENKKWPKLEIVKEPFEKIILLQKFANLVEKNMELLCQISAEEKIRKEDTKKGVQLLVDYLNFYASCTMVMGENDSSKGDLLCIFDQYVYPGLLGMILGPILALGTAIVITANIQLDFYVLLAELATEAGFSPGTITISKVEKTVAWDLSKWNKWERVIHFGYDDIFDSGNNTTKIGRLLNIQYGKSPMIVFDSADQQSACEILIDAVWAYNGQLPWSVDTVFVQENIWDNFITKVKRTVNQHSLGYVSMQNCSPEIDQLIIDAKSRGIDIYQGYNDNNLVVFIGQRVYENNVIKPNKQFVPTLTVLPFRTINEGIALANNNRQGIAASIWGENISQVNEAAKKLQVGTVWINSFGLFKPGVTFMPWKESGCGYFGGINGLLEHHIIPKKKNVDKAVQKIDSKSIKSLYNVATSAQTNWAKIGYTNRLNILLKCLDGLYRQNPKSNDWITAIYKSLTTSSKNSGDFIDFNDYDLKCFKEPIGITVFEDIVDVKDKELLFMSLLLGNVVIVGDNKDATGAILMQRFPSGVYNVAQNMNDTFAIANEQNIQLITKSNFGFTQKSRHIDEKIAELYLTKSKNVWTAIGQTYC